MLRPAFRNSTAKRPCSIRAASIRCPCSGRAKMALRCNLIVVAMMAMAPGHVRPAGDDAFPCHGALPEGRPRPVSRQPGSSAGPYAGRCSVPGILAVAVKRAEIDDFDM